MVNSVRQLLIILLVSVILGSVISFKDISLCLYMYDSVPPQEAWPVLANTIEHISYSVILIFCLLCINTGLKKKKYKNEAVLFIFSMLFTVVLFYLAGLVINQDIPEAYIKMFRDEHHHGKGHKIDFLAVRSFYILVIVYTGSLIFKLYRNKLETERSLEKLKSESLQSRLTALSNQINPHFFFNALNSLHSLIIEDRKENSLAYLSNLSNVFRYILRSDVRTMVSLKEELAFLDEYQDMLSVKYGEKLFIERLIDMKYHLFSLPVMTLLPLIENVTKHNEISSRNPMTIRISADSETLTITNKIQKKIDPVVSEGTGLRNLNNRCKILTGRGITVEEKDGEFSVRVPLTEERQ